MGLMSTSFCPGTLIDLVLSAYFFFNDTATPEIYTLTLHDALPIWYRDTLDQFA